MAVNNSNQEAVSLREQRKKERREEKEKALKEGRKRIRIRLIPIWLRVIIVAILLVVSTVSGAMVGYSVMGNGKATDVFDKSTWTHIVDLVNSDK